MHPKNAFQSDNLLPVITLVIYWSPDEWDAPRSIHEMLALPDKELLKFLPDYRINLISPKEIIRNKPQRRQ